MAHDQSVPPPAAADRRRRARAAGSARAADTATDISFYFPVAVGGPITKIIDGYAADFQRENPSIKVTPIYAGTLSGHPDQGADRAEGERRSRSLPCCYPPMCSP